MLYLKEVNPHENAERTLASLTQHALYDVSHHRIKKTSVLVRPHENGIPTFSKISTPRTFFKNQRCWCPKPP